MDTEMQSMMICTFRWLF